MTKDPKCGHRHGNDPKKRAPDAVCQLDVTGDLNRKNETDVCAADDQEVEPVARAAVPPVEDCPDDCGEDPEKKKVPSVLSDHTGLQRRQVHGQLVDGDGAANERNGPRASNGPNAMK